MAKLDIHQFPCRSDNYGVLIHDAATSLTASIDAPDAGEVLDAVEETGWGLSHIFTTHHHPDHVAGNEILKERYGCEIVGPANETIPAIDRRVSGGDAFEWSRREVRVIDTPGHTAGEISFHLPADGLLFAGDTLFAMGCGRLFEGTPEQMWTSLRRLMELPDETMVYAGHEYTLSNARFAVSVDPDNDALRERLAEVERLRAAGRPTLPTTIGREKETNPFLRVGDRSLRSAIDMMEASDVDVFAKVRALKDAA